MPVKRRKAKQRRAEIPADLVAFLKDEGISLSVKYLTDEATIRAAWRELRDTILAGWVEEQPGKRPSAWWRFDAPRQPAGRFPGWYYDGKLPEPRERCGGVGTPAHEVLADAPRYNFGIPDSWVKQWAVDYYNGRALDVHGERIGTDYAEGDFEGLAIDSENPPVFESEATYLDRHGLLLPGEKERLRKSDWEPEFVLPYSEPAEDEPPPEAA